MNEPAAGWWILEQPLPDGVDRRQSGTRGMTVAGEREVTFIGDGVAARSHDAQHLAYDAFGIGHVNQEVTAEDNVEGRIREWQLRRVTLLKPHARWVLGLVCA